MGRGFSRSWTSVNAVENETSGHEVMKAAGFTHGGFYNHFPLLSELVGAIILARAVAQANRPFQTRF